MRSTLTLRRVVVIGVLMLNVFLIPGIVDSRTVTFHFKEPFLDFLLYYATPASAAGIIIPKAYYLSLGSTNAERDEKFAQAPIGAGPYKFVRQEPGIEVEFAAFTDYWRKVPHVKTVISRGVRELPVRVAAISARLWEPISTAGIFSAGSFTAPACPSSSASSGRSWPARLERS